MSEQWISLEQATEITGASEAIIRDTIGKYQDNPQQLKVKQEHGLIYLDKAQLVSLFPESANPVEKEKIPGTVFRWFDELRRAYETSVDTMFKKVEKVKDQHREDIEKSYQSRLKELEIHQQNHLRDLKTVHSESLSNMQQHIDKLERDTQFYQQQVIAQQNTISQLNTRYDAVVLHLKNRDPLDATPEKDITPDQRHLATDELNPESTTNNVETPPSATHSHPEPLDTPEQTSQEQSKKPEPTERLEQVDVEALVKQAYELRDINDYKQSNVLFEQAALHGHARAMGALGRCYVIGEGVESNLEQGIAWLHLAAKHGFTPAIKKVEQIQQKYADEFEHGLALAKTYEIQIKLNKQEDEME